jgi:hypothetical protein
MHYKAGDYTNCGNLISRPHMNGAILVPCQRLMPYDGIALLPNVKRADGEYVDLPCDTCKHAKPVLAPRLPSMIRYPSR